MPLFLCPKYAKYKMLVRQDPPYQEGLQMITPPPVYAEFENRQYYTEDEKIAAFIRKTNTFKNGIVIEVDDTAFKANKDIPPEKVPSVIEEEKKQADAEKAAIVANTCRYCGQVCKSPAGLSAHMKRCKRRPIDEPSANNDKDASDSVGESGSVRAEDSG